MAMLFDVLCRCSTVMQVPLCYFNSIILFSVSVVLFTPVNLKNILTSQISLLNKLVLVFIASRRWFGIVMFRVSKRSVQRRTNALSQRELPSNIEID